MAFDGITIANLVHEFKEALGGGRISKIAQPEKDELLIAIKNNRENYRLQISASASLPLIYLTDKNKPSPMTAPNFCMLLRKHIGSARIVDISQPGLERIIQFELEHLDEMGDLCRKILIVEITATSFSARRTAPSSTASSMCPLRSALSARCCRDEPISSPRPLPRKILFRSQRKPSARQ